MRGSDVEVLLWAGYAIFLALVAAALELFARHSHQRTQRVHTVGFSYHADLDVWKCPNGKHLYRAEVIRESTVVRYRGLAHQCNSCPIKNRCTDSDDGRVIEVQCDSWLQSELRNFHRGLSLTLLLLADLILVVTILRQNNARDQLLLALPLLCITDAGLRLSPRFFRPTEKNTPRGERILQQLTLDNREELRIAAPALVSTLKKVMVTTLRSHKATRKNVPEQRERRGAVQDET